MTLMKSLLLGSAATFVVVAGAQAADLPTRKGAPAAEYVRICKIGDIAGFIIPGTDTCLKIGGLISAQTTFGSTADQYAIGTSATAHTVNSLYLANPARDRDQVGMYTRGRLALDAVSNTAYGPLLAHINIEENVGAGFDSGANYGTIDGAYLQWAGITAGYHTSFFDFIGGGNAWDDLDSPKFDPTQQLAYTATFGGGFSATLSLEQPQPAVYASNTTALGVGEPLYGNLYNTGKLGMQSPDIVASLDVTQGWGSAKLAGVAHQVRQYALSPLGAEADTNTWGWGVIGGVSFNIPGLGAGADVKLQGEYLDGALQYSHLFSTGDYNFSGVSYNGAAADAYYNAWSGSWEKPIVWGAAVQVDLPLGPTFKVVPEAAYEHIHIGGTAGNGASGGLYGFSSVSPNVGAWIGGGTLEWTPVKNLVFDLDLLYANMHEDAPTGWSGVGVNAWKSTADGFNGKLRIERDF
jgi:hypothetical protein